MPTTLVLADKHPIATLSDADRLAILDDVLQRYADGEEIRDIAPDYAVSYVMIYSYLLAERSEEFKRLQVSRAMIGFEKAATDRDMYAEQARTSADQFALNKANSMLKYAETAEKRNQWLLERCLSRIYGQEKAANQAPVAIQINLSREQAIEVKPV